MAKLVFQSEHRNTGKRNPASKGRLDRVYAFVGTKDEVTDFKESQKEFFIEGENGEALMISSRDLGETANVVKRKSDGRWTPVVDEKDLRIGKLYKLATKYPAFAGSFGDKASAIATEEDTRPASTSTKAPVQKAVAEGAGLGQD